MQWKYPGRFQDLRIDIKASVGLRTARAATAASSVRQPVSRAGSFMVSQTIATFRHPR